MEIFLGFLGLLILLGVFLKVKGYIDFEINKIPQAPLTKREIFAQKFPDVDVNLYRKRYKLMNQSESSFFYLAQKSLPEGYFIFPKMRIADVIETLDGKGYYKQRNKILPKHIDFVVCDQVLRPVCAVEIDGPSHDKPKQQERDELVDYIFETVGIPLKRVRVGDNFEVVCEKMAHFLKGQV